MKTGENPLNLTKSKRSRIGFKAGLNGREWCCAGLFGPVFCCYCATGKILRFRINFSILQGNLQPWYDQIKCGGAVDIHKQSPQRVLRGNRQGLLQLSWILWQLRRMGRAYFPIIILFFIMEFLLSVIIVIICSLVIIDIILSIMDAICSGVIFIIILSIIIIIFSLSIAIH